nr:MAG TPA: hypothetical protein [Caudoviricetes sp.]DAR36010.1 MAG TPA: hypothetical protein [Caudoviricetes sp.]
MPITTIGIFYLYSLVRSIIIHHIRDKTKLTLKCRMCKACRT